MKKYNIPIIDIQSFGAENVITTSTAETWQQGYEDQGAVVNRISYSSDLQDIITFTF